MQTVVKMKKKIGLLIVLFCCILDFISSGQSVTEILGSSMDSLRKIKTIQYQVAYQHSIAGFQDKNLQAGIIAERGTDSLFGMQFIVNKDSIENIYDGRFAFEINHRVGEVMQLNPNILNKKGITELLIREIFQGYEKEAFSGHTSNFDTTSVYYTIVYNIVNDKGKTVKKIFINRLTRIPEKYEFSFYNNGKKEVTLITLFEVVINTKNIPRVDTRIIAYLDKYTLLPIEDIGMPVTIDARDSLIGKTAPDFVLKTLGDKSIKLSDFKGNLVLLDFWEVWCGPCRMSMPHLQELHDQYKDRGLVILGITKDNPNAAKGLLSKRKVTYENLAGTNQVTKDYKIVEIPQYYLIDENGIIIYASKNGFEQKMEDMIGKLIK